MLQLWTSGAPDRELSEAKAIREPPENLAPFVCFASGMENEPMEHRSQAGQPPETHQEVLEQSLSAQALSANSTTTQEAVLQGKCVIDCGATKSLGSIHALEQVVRKAEDLGLGSGTAQRIHACPPCTSM